MNEKDENLNYIKKNTSGKSVILLQETHSTQKVENLWCYQWHGDMIFSHGTSGSRGICVAFRYDLEYKTLSLQIVDKKKVHYSAYRNSRKSVNHFKLLWP